MNPTMDYHADESFSKDATKVLRDYQLLMDGNALREQRDDDKIEQICHVMHKLGGNSDGHQIAELAVTHLQLAVFYLKHLTHCGCKGSLEDAKS